MIGMKHCQWWDFKFQISNFKFLIFNVRVERKGGQWTMDICDEATSLKKLFWLYVPEGARSL